MNCFKRFWRKVREKVDKWLDRLGTKIGEAIVPIEPDPEPELKPEAEAVPDNKLFAELHWDRGGQDCSKAVRASATEIADLMVYGTRKMTYSWLSGGCEDLGARRADQANCLACFFCKIKGEWHGGKFDWISTSRTSREFTNINTGYHGWSAEDLASADEYAFVITSGDRTVRTNVITKAAHG